MNFWWVNHKQTHVAEISGGYIWSPKTEKNGARSQFYINLTLTRPGDIVFSYADTQIKAIGVVTNNHRAQSKPAEFGNAGENWADAGWLAPIEWQLLDHPFTPKAHIGRIAPLLPDMYSPITKAGNGNQKCYLAQISEDLANLLLSIANNENATVKDQIDGLQSDVDTDIKVQEVLQANIDATEKEQLVKARIGQGVFKQNLIKVEKACRLTGISDSTYLVASHIKPWSKCDNNERLDGSNGLLLSPHVDRLFDKGWISFEDNGDLIVSNQATEEVMASWSLNRNVNVGTFSDAQKLYMAYHRANILKNH